MGERKKYVGRMGVSLLGADKMARKLGALPERMQRALAGGLYTEANAMLADAMKRAPVDFGTLRASGYVTLPRTEGTRTTVELGFGGPAADYALRQHEELGWRHPEGGEAKYLERAVNARAGDVARDVGAHVARILASGRDPPAVAATAPQVPSGTAPPIEQVRERARARARRDRAERKRQKKS